MPFQHGQTVTYREDDIHSTFFLYLVLFEFFVKKEDRVFSSDDYARLMQSAFVFSNFDIPYCHALAQATLDATPDPLIEAIWHQDVYGFTKYQSKLQPFNGLNNIEEAQLELADYMKYIVTAMLEGKQDEVSKQLGSAIHCLSLLDAANKQGKFNDKSSIKRLWDEVSRLRRGAQGITGFEC